MNPVIQPYKDKLNTWRQSGLSYIEWLNSLPSNLRNTGSEYDMQAAYRDGIQPEYITEDDSYHMQSRNPETGRIYKQWWHPTFDKTIQAEIEQGYRIITGQDGLYSIPKTSFN